MQSVGKPAAPWEQTSKLQSGDPDPSFMREKRLRNQSTTTVSKEIRQALDLMSLNERLQALHLMQKLMDDDSNK